MLKKVIEIKEAFNEETAQKVAQLCNAFDGMVMIETGKRTANGNKAEALLKSRAVPGERIRIIIEGSDGEEELYQALKELLEN
ncbi:HPr family phosphocarrier protein [Clostridia bacterium OttesenSCG-928-F22]|nr:HPr family phosphocarrier protein [Clostridia bacterium OttesenSCG-928-F22]